MSFEVNLAKSPHEVETTSSVSVTSSDSSVPFYQMDTGKLFHVPLPNDEQTKAMAEEMENRWMDSIDMAKAYADAWKNLPRTDDGFLKYGDSDNTIKTSTTLPIPDVPNDICEETGLALADNMSVMSSYYPDGSKSYTVTDVKTLEDVTTILLMMKRLMEE